jgi:capsular polysaccharide export protein
MQASDRLRSALAAPANFPAWTAVGFSAAKRRMLQRYLHALGQSSGFTKSNQQEKVMLAWGATPAPHFLARVEDGFIRSVGLGADLVRPLSWVFDTRGIYFDANHPSDLEWLLQHRQFTAQETERARVLRQNLVTTGLTKYNVGTGHWSRPGNGKRVVVVVGQVESDASIRLGSHTLCSNMQLLERSRRDCPNDYLVYKPHPDVLAGLRSGDLHAEQAAQWCDEVVTDTNMADLLSQVDAMHVMTSLAGFEALLRGVPVTCYGSPFYAGWGLCTEPHVLPSAQARRKRRLSLDQLVACALIDYPSYLHPEQDVLISVEQAVVMLQKQRSQLGLQVQRSRFQRFGLAVFAKLQKRY